MDVLWGLNAESQAKTEHKKCVRKGHLANSFMSWTFSEFYSNQLNGKNTYFNSPLTQAQQHTTCKYAGNKNELPNAQHSFNVFSILSSFELCLYSNAVIINFQCQSVGYGTVCCAAVTESSLEFFIHLVKRPADGWYIIQNFVELNIRSVSIEIITSQLYFGVNLRIIICINAQHSNAFTEYGELRIENI